MDALGSYLFGELIKALAEGNAIKFMAYLAIFLILWLELKGLKKSVNNLTSTIAKSFADGEKRFEALEAKQNEFEHRLTMLEPNRGG